MRVKIFIDFKRPFAELDLTTRPAEDAEEVRLRLPLIKKVGDRRPTTASLASVLSVLRPRPNTSVELSTIFLGYLGVQGLGNTLRSLDGTEVSSIDLSDNDLHMLISDGLKARTYLLTNALATALSGIPHSIKSVGLSNNKLSYFGVKDLRNALVVLNNAGVSSVDLSWNQLYALEAQGLRELFTDLPAITTLNLSFNQLRRWVGVDGLTMVLASVSARRVILSDDDLNLSDEELAHLLKEMSSTVNEILCVSYKEEPNINQARVNRIFNQIRQDAANSIEESIPNMPRDISSVVMQYATHGFWQSSRPKVTTHDITLSEDNPETKENNIDTQMPLR